MEKNFQTPGISEGSEFIKNKSRDNVSQVAVSAAADLLTDQGEVTIFMG